MDGCRLGRGPIGDIAPIGGGTQNVMVRFVRDGRPFVLRRGPLHLRPHSNAAIRREIRLLDALASTIVPHPGLIAACPDEDVLDGAAFYLMEPVDGFNAKIELPALHAGRADLRNRMGLEIVDTLAAIGEVDHRAVGLGGFGRPDGFLERQVGRWLAELESYRELDGYAGGTLPGVDMIADWLERRRPASWTPGLIHGDYHLANVMYSRQGPEVVAVVDWEMATIGDPLLDLGWLLALWPDDTDGPDVLDSRLAAAGGLPTGAELVARYAQRSSRDLSAMPWYSVLACFKLGIVLEGSYARAQAGKASREIGDGLRATTLTLLERARRIIAGA